MTRAARVRPSFDSVAPVRTGVPQRREVPLEVHPDDGVPLLLGGVDQHPVADEAGVVDEDVEAAERVDCLLHHRLGLGEVGDIGTVGHRLTAERLDLGHDPSRPATRRRSHPPARRRSR